jgi:hypothetical protein
VSLQVEQMLCREEKQCALNDRIIKNGPQNENQRFATAFFSSLLECPLFLCGGCAISAISALIPEVGIFGASGGGPNGGGAATSAAGLGLTADEAQGL